MEINPDTGKSLSCKKHILAYWRKLWEGLFPPLEVSRKCVLMLVSLAQYSTALNTWIEFQSNHDKSTLEYLSFLALCNLQKVYPLKFSNKTFFGQWLTRILSKHSREEEPDAKKKHPPSDTWESLICQRSALKMQGFKRFCNRSTLGKEPSKT